jgi:hypothetical protein
MSPVIAMAVLLVADQFTGSARKGETARTESSGAKNAIVERINFSPNAP